jgi:hypothetical protein
LSSCASCGLRLASTSAEALACRRLEWGLHRAEQAFEEMILLGHARRPSGVRVGDTLWWTAGGARRIQTPATLGLGQWKVAQDLKP